MINTRKELITQVYAPWRSGGGSQNTATNSSQGTTLPGYKTAVVLASDKGVIRSNTGVFVSKSKVEENMDTLDIKDIELKDLC